MRTFTPLAEVVRLQSLRIDLNSCEFSDSQEPTVNMAVAITEESSVSCRTCNRCGTRMRPPRLSKTAHRLTHARGWKTWQKHLRTRKKPIAPPFTARKSSRRCCGVGRSIGNATSYKLRSYRRQRSPRLPLAKMQSPRPICRCRCNWSRLPMRCRNWPQELPAETWWFLVERLHATATQAQLATCRLIGRPAGRRAKPIACRRTAARAELPVSRSARTACAPQRRTCRALRSARRTDRRPGLAARATVARARSAVRLLDALPLARQAPSWRPLVARGGAAIPMARATRDSAGGRRRPFLLSSPSPDMAGYVDFTANDWKRQLFEMAIAWPATAAIALRPTMPCRAASSRKSGDANPLVRLRRRSIPIGPASRSWPMAGRNPTPGWPSLTPAIHRHSSSVVDGERVFAGAWTCEHDLRRQTRRGRRRVGATLLGDRQAV